MTDDTVAYMGWGISAQEQIDGFRREVRELKAENALLWEQGALLFDKTQELGTENAKLRELFDITYGYYVSGTLTLCDICGKYDCEGNVPITCKSDEYDPDGMVVEEIERRMRELGIEVES